MGPCSQKPRQPVTTTWTFSARFCSASSFLNASTTASPPPEQQAVPPQTRT